MSRPTGRSIARVAAAAASIGVAGVAATEQAHASLIIDVRATAVNGSPLSVGNSGKIVVVQPGDTVTLALFAVISGTNGINDETVQAAHGAIISQGLGGNLSAHVVAPFNGNGHQNGQVQDLDGDTDLDVGSGPNGGVSTHFFLARSNVQENGTITSANSEEIQIGTANFVVTDGGETFINFFRRASASGGNISTAATWFEDGQIKSPTNGVFGVGTPVQTWIPEPASATLTAAALASLGLLARRRNDKAAH